MASNCATSCKACSVAIGAVSRLIRSPRRLLKLGIQILPLRALRVVRVDCRLEVLCFVRQVVRGAVEMALPFTEIGSFRFQHRLYSCLQQKLVSALKARRQTEHPTKRSERHSRRSTPAGAAAGTTGLGASDARLRLLVICLRMSSMHRIGSFGDVGTPHCSLFGSSSTCLPLSLSLSLFLACLHGV